MNRWLVIVILIVSLCSISGSYAQIPDNYGFLKVRVTKAGTPLASYPVVIKQFVPATLNADGASRTIHLRRFTNANGFTSFNDKIHVSCPFLLIVGAANNDKYEYFVTRRQIRTPQDPTATDIIANVDFPRDARFNMTKLGKSDLCRITLTLKNYPFTLRRGLKFLLKCKAGHQELTVSQKPPNFDFLVPTPASDETEPLNYTVILKDGNTFVRSFLFVVRPGETRKARVVDLRGAPTSSGNQGPEKANTPDPNPKSEKGTPEDPMEPGLDSPNTPAPEPKSEEPKDKENQGQADSSSKE